MRKILLSVGMMVASNLVFGQALKTIEEIQAPKNLTACNDSSMLVGQTVKVRGVLIMDANLTWSNATGRNFYIQTGDGANQALHIRQGSSTLQTNISTLLAGDSVEIEGVVEEFSGETGFNPNANNDFLVSGILGSGTVRMKTFTDISQFNDANRKNKFTTGEQWEGQFVEIQGPLTVTLVDLFSGGTRCSFDVVDASGNKMNVTDLFAAQRLATNGGTFVPPVVGDVFTSLKGVIIHSKNDDPTLGCGGPTTGRGYSLAPFDASHYQAGASAPSITAFTRNPITPTTAQNTTITVQITDDGSVSSAELKYAVGVSSTTYTTLSPASVSGNTYTFTIPSSAYSEGSFVKYYVTATDNSSLVANIPNVPGNADPLAFRVRDNGTQINDVQFTPYTGGNSIYKDMEVTVTGVVIASASTSGAGDLGYVYIQQEGLQSWAGLSVIGSTSLSTLTRGQKVSVTGVIKENFFETRMEQVSNVTVLGTGTITPLVLAPSIFSTYSFANNEQYEGMLIKLQNPTTGQPIYVVDANADGTNLTTNNNAEYRVGTDVFDPNNGTRVLAGRVTSSSFSSLYVSYVNDPIWATTSGTMQVGVSQVTEGTSMDDVTGVITYTFSQMKLLPRNNSDFTNVAGLLSAKKVAEKTVTQFGIYPNPATNSFLVNGLESKAVVSIYNSIGSLVATQTIDAINSSVSLENVANGTYLVRVTNENGSVNQAKISVIK